MITEDNNNNFMIGHISVSPQHNTITKDEKSCRLQPKAMALLHYLASNKDRVINNDELLDQVWQGRVVTHGSIQKCVNTLRSAFSELDDGVEYVHYFSKRGYQLISPDDDIHPLETNQSSPKKVTKTTFITIIITVMMLLSATVYWGDALKIENSSTKAPVDANQPFHSQPSVSQYVLPVFTQVKPYISNTGREKLIAPHQSSERVAFIRDEASAEELKVNPTKDEETTGTESRLYIKGAHGRTWQASVARGKFVAIAWSPSGRNLVAIDVHAENNRVATNNEASAQEYYTFHIYTLDFKTEKVIEKNLLSHWHGKVSSVSWWDEATLEFTASQSSNKQRQRYRYGIADQNLAMLKTTETKGKLLATDIINKKTATLSLLNTLEQVHFFDEQQELQSEWSIPFKVLSMNWLANEKGVLLLSADNQLSVLYTDGRLQAVEYSPKLNSRISQARSKDNGQKIVLTVTSNSKLENGGGFIYSALEE